jgi:hypothetical protein
VTLVLALFVMLGGVLLAATGAPRAGGILVIAGWATAIGALHALGRAKA